MFLGRKSRDRMIGIVGAYAVLIAGVIFTGAFDSAPVVVSPVDPVLKHRSAEAPDDSLSSRQQRADVFC